MNSKNLLHEQSEPEIPQEPQEPQSPKVPWTIWDAIIALIVVPSITNGGILVISAIKALVTGGKIPMLKLILTALAIQYTISFFAVFLIAIVIRKASWSTLGFRSFNLLRGLGLAFVSYLTVEIGVIVYAIILALFHVSRPPDRALQVILQFIKSGSNGLILAIIIVAVIAPIMEELFFRGFIYPVFRQRWGVTNAIFLSSALFAISHLSLYNFIPLFIVGAALAYLYQRTGSLGPSIMLHALNNFVSVLVIYYFGGKLSV